MDSLRIVTFKKPVYTIGKGYETVDSRGHFHKWVYAYTINEAGDTVTRPLGLIEDKEGKLHQVEIENFHFTGGSSNPNDKLTFDEILNSMYSEDKDQTSY